MCPTSQMGDNMIGYFFFRWRFANPRITRISIGHKITTVILKEFQRPFLAAVYCKIVQRVLESFTILELIEKKILIKDAAGGRSTGYSLKDIKSERSK